MCYIYSWHSNYYSEHSEQDGPQYGSQTYNSPVEICEQIQPVMAPLSLTYP